MFLHPLFIQATYIAFPTMTAGITQHHPSFDIAYLMEYMDFEGSTVDSGTKLLTKMLRVLVCTDIRFYLSPQI